MSCLSDTSKALPTIFVTLQVVYHTLSQPPKRIQAKRHIQEHTHPTKPAATRLCGLGVWQYAPTILQTRMDIGFTKSILKNLPLTAFSRESMSVSLHISDTLEKQYCIQKRCPPLEKGAEEIFLNDPGIRHANSTVWRRRVPKLYAWSLSTTLSIRLNIRV